jgi:AraC family transcriptional regulator
VTDIALEAGYDSPEAFTHAFVRVFGLAPSAWQHDEGARRPVPSTPPPAVEVRSLSAVDVMSERHVGSYTRVNEAFARVVKRGLVVGRTGPLYGLCPDDPDVTREALLRFDACLAADRKDGPGPIATIPGGRYAIAVHHGSYATLSETYLALIGHWLPTTRFELRDEPVVEAYLNDPTTCAAADLRTEVRVRLAE